jgi:hypothetical protein
MNYGLKKTAWIFPNSEQLRLRLRVLTLWDFWNRPHRTWFCGDWNASTSHKPDSEDIRHELPENRFSLTTDNHFQRYALLSRIAMLCKRSCNQLATAQDKCY